MDDLSGLSWTPSPAKPQAAPASAAAYNTGNASLRSSSTLSSRTTSPAMGASARSGAGPGDSFANLVTFGNGAAKANAKLSLQEQQRQLEEKRRKDAEEKQRKMDALFGGGTSGGGGSSDAQFWDVLGSGSASAATATAATTSPPVLDDEDDLLAAFNAAAPVDKSSHYPPPPSTASVASPASSQAQSLNPFDLDILSSSHTPPPPSQPNTSQDDDFDILGDLAKPVSELPPRREPTPPSRPESRPEPVRERSPPREADPRDSAIAEIMEMGFSTQQAKKALAKTDTGLDVQAAVTWLLEEAHRKSRPAPTRESRSESPHEGQRSRPREGPSSARRSRDNSATPAWARGNNTGEKDLGAIAAEVGGNLFKSANNLWNTSKKKIEKAVAEFQADDDPNMPKWMREQQIRDQLAARGAQVRKHRPDNPEEAAGQEESTPRPGKKQAAPEITEEAMMLEMGGGPPPRRRTQRESLGPEPPVTAAIPGQSERQRQQQQALAAAIAEKERELRQRERDRFHAAASAIPDSSSRRKKLAEEDPAPTYVSRNRRRPAPASASKPATPEPDLLAGGGTRSAPPTSNNPFARDLVVEQQESRTRTPTRRNGTPAPPVPAPARKRPPPQRPNIPLSPSALQASTAARQKGTEAFKRGDYTAAQAHYTSSLTPIPEQHTLRIILLTNRALCNLKLGDPKATLADTDAILALVGDARGDDETIALDGADKPMREYWGKAITRRAEALEQLEKWADARTAWETALAAGVGGAVASAGKRRCESALNPPPKAKPRPTTAATTTTAKPPARPKTTQADAAAVRALRESNAAAERTDAEKDALYDVVEARVGAWKAGKEGNLRALLAGLDTVLWEGAGWKKVGMGELLAPNKCKIAYMKGIAKVHPDKVSVTATTEQKMISKEVFSLLNEAWDKFKAENGL